MFLSLCLSLALCFPPLSLSIHTYMSIYLFRCKYIVKMPKSQQIIYDATVARIASENQVCKYINVSTSISITISIFLSFFVRSFSVYSLSMYIRLYLYIICIYIYIYSTTRPSHESQRRTRYVYT